MNFRFICAMSAATGYTALSQEIIWYRLVSFATGGSPRAFAYVLGMFLFGIAVGALLSGKLVARAEARLAEAMTTLLLLSTLVAYALVPTAAAAISHTGVGLLAIYLAVFVVALMSGIIFPILCHIGIESSSVGASLSKIYFWNIVGSILGPLVTTFVLMDLVSLDQVVLVITGAGLLSALTAAMFLPLSAGARAKLGLAIATATLAILIAHTSLYDQLYGKFQFKTEAKAKLPYVSLVETRSGVVSVTNEDDDHIIYGGGVYDGRFTIDPVRDSNLISRAYMMASLHRKPAHVLEIGLSSGSWSRVLAAHRHVERLTIVEINPGYERTIRSFTQYGNVLDDPKVEVVYDDGRRWLNRNPDERFDVILMNTTWHWRSQISALLSTEFLELVKSHLSPGGVLYYNTTWSDDVIHTAAMSFKHVVRYLNFIAASDSPFDMTDGERLASVKEFIGPDGTPLLKGESADEAKVVGTLATLPLTDVRDEFAARDDLWRITDDNMATEYKTGDQLYAKKRSWMALLGRIRSGAVGKEPTAPESTQSH